MLKASAALRRAVMDELAWDSVANAACIGVSAAAGAVTLTGHVRSYAEKRAAEKAATRVSGVVAVANELEVRVPSSTKRDDTDIAGAVGAALTWNASVPEGITAVVDQGWVTLDGAADLPFQRRAAENAVRAIVGVRGVTNLIRVAARTGPA